MANGKVDFFNDTGGYGFISTDDSDEDVFFHMEDVGGPDLEEGADIDFDIEQSPKGPRATNVVRNYYRLQAPHSDIVGRFCPDIPGANRNTRSRRARNPKR